MVYCNTWLRSKVVVLGSSATSHENGPRISQASLLVFVDVTCMVSENDAVAVSNLFEITKPRLMDRVIDFAIVSDEKALKQVNSNAHVCLSY